MTKDLIKKGFDAAEKEHQENEVKKIKEIVQKHLEKLSFHHEQAKEHQEKERLLKKDLDDLKAGRLDKIEERQEKDEKAREVRIIIVKRVEKEYIPIYPWRSPWWIEWATPVYSNLLVDNSGLSFTTTSTGNSFQITGITCSNFAPGSYIVNGRTVNL